MRRVTDARGGLPLLGADERSGRTHVDPGRRALPGDRAGRTRQLLGGVPGVPAAKVVILGGGVVGTNAARMAMGLEAHVTVLDVSLPRLYELDLQFGSQHAHDLFDHRHDRRACDGADLVIGGVLLPGAAAPKLITARW